MMFMAIPGFKLAMMAAAAIGIGAAVVTHWDDIRFIVENFEECKEEAKRSYKRMQNRKVVAGEYSRRSESPEPDIFYSNDYEDVYDSDATTRDGAVLRHRRGSDVYEDAEDHSQSHSFNQRQSRNHNQSSSQHSRSSSSSSLMSSEDSSDFGIIEASQLSMPSNHNISQGFLEISDVESSIEPMSDFSIISSDGEWTDNSWGSAN